MNFLNEWTITASIVDHVIPTANMTIGTIIEKFVCKLVYAVAQKTITNGFGKVIIIPIITGCKSFCFLIISTFVMFFLKTVLSPEIPK